MMPGEYGTIRQYVRAHWECGGKPPIPEWSDHSRGEPRSRPVWIALLVTSLAFGIVPLLPVIAVLPQDPSTPLVASLAFLWFSAAYHVTGMVLNPLADWWGDLPRRGLAKVEAEYDAGLVDDRRADA